MSYPARGRHVSSDASQLLFGICTSAKRFLSPHFSAFISVLREMRLFHIYELNEDFVSTTPVEDWPFLDCLLVIYSPKLDLGAILRYVERNDPYLVNDVHFQYLLKDRRLIVQTLEEHGIRAPPFWLLSPADEVKEFDDHILINSTSVQKPFIEKPLDTEDHSLAIYYTSETGRGCTLLGKENEVRSCEYLRGENRRRRDKEYLYQPFLQTDGFDIKVFAVGTDYFHAEAKKSPVINSVRTAGNEKKYPVMLTAEEKELAIKVVQAFRQNVVMFDVIRCEGKSYVVDVNTGNLVKGPQRAIWECARTLGLHVLKALKKPERSPDPDTSIPHEPCIPLLKREHLCAVVAIFRHGDRTPKQKVKYRTSNRRFLGLFCGVKEVKLKRNEDLVLLMEITKEVSAEERDSEELLTIRDVLEQGLTQEYTPKAQMKPLSIDCGQVTKALLILKWGGTLTHAGVHQCERTGRLFRSMHYQNDDETFHRLHSTYEHDIKCYSSSEGRCQKSAGAFLRGLLDLDSDINAVATCMVRKDAPVVKMLDESPPASDCESPLKPLSSLFNSDQPLLSTLSPYHSDLPAVLLTTAAAVGSPKAYLLRVYSLIGELLTSLEDKLRHGGELCGNESHHLIHQRWQGMHRNFYNQATQEFAIGCIPALNDCIRYDVLHNRELVGEVGKAIFDSIRYFSKLVSNLEYGFTKQEKLNYCGKVVVKLMQKLSADLRFWTSMETTHSEELIGDQSYHWYRPISKHTRTRFYFTSLSHLNSILTLLTQQAKKWQENSLLEHVMSLEYLGHFVIKLYEDQQESPFNSRRFRGELWMSPGVNLSNLEEVRDHTAPVSEAVKIHGNLSLSDLEALFSTSPPASYS